MMDMNLNSRVLSFSPKVHMAMRFKNFLALLPNDCGVLVERTIKEVLPAVLRNKEGLEEVVTCMKDALEKKNKDITEFKLKYRTRTRKGNNNCEEDVSMKEASMHRVFLLALQGSRA